MEGLTRYDSTGKVVGGVATKWEISDQKATFHLRKDAKWSDGKPLTAKDFVFSWRLAVNPKTASEYAFILYYVKNGELINKGKAPVTDLGVKAVDDQTLEVTFERPCGFFTQLTSFVTFYPIREDYYQSQGERYAANAENMICNGPFKLTKWVHGASLRMEKNENYWNQSSIQVAAIDVPFITPDDGARFNLFKTKKIDFMNLSKDNIANAQREKFKLSKFSDGSVFYMLFNFRPGRVTQNKNLRKAIQALFSPEEYVSRVVGIPGTQLGVGLVPVFLMGSANKPFRKEFPLPPQKQNIANAKKLMALAMKELKLSDPPSLIWLTGDSPLAIKEAEYFQSLFKTHLGIDLKIDKQIFKQRLAKQRSGEFDICSAGWGPDYADPMTFIDLFSSWNENNHGKWVNAQYDELVKQASSTSKTKDRMELMAKAEKIVIEDGALIPMYERTRIYTFSSRLKGIVRRAVGADPDFTGVKITE